MFHKLYKKTLCPFILCLSTCLLSLFHAIHKTAALVTTFMNPKSTGSNIVNVAEVSQYAYISYVISWQTIHKNIIQYLAEVHLLSIMSCRKQNLTKERGQNAQYNKVLLPDNYISGQYLISYKFPKYCDTHQSPKIQLTDILTSNSISNLLISLVALFSFSSSI